MGKMLIFQIFFIVFILREKEGGEMSIADPILFFFEGSSEGVSCIKNLINKVKEKREKRSNCDDHIYSATNSRKTRG